MNIVTDTRKKLRKDLRKKRNSLSRMQQINASQQLSKYLKSSPVFLRSKNIAFYVASDGEINLSPIMNLAEKMGKNCYLPILHPLKQRALWFGHYRNQDILSLNRFGMPEPVFSRPQLPAWALDLVLMPLVGFDRKGNRLGMGGGFYDHTFAFTKNNVSRPGRPVLIGVAHHCQEVKKLDGESWDVMLDAVATDREIIFF